MRVKEEQLEGFISYFKAHDCKGQKHWVRYPYVEDAIAHQIESSFRLAYRPHPQVLTDG